MSRDDLERGPLCQFIHGRHWVLRSRDVPTVGSRRFLGDTMYVVVAVDPLPGRRLRVFVEPDASFAELPGYSGDAPVVRRGDLSSPTTACGSNPERSGDRRR